MTKAEWYVRAIQKLAPSAEFVFSGEDLTTLDWLSPDIAQPSIAAIEEALVVLQAELATEAATKAAARQALLDKLGITEDEAKLLLS